MAGRAQSDTFLCAHPAPSGRDRDTEAALTLPSPFRRVLLPTRSFNFISHCFYLTARGLHLGLLKTCARYSGLLRDLNVVHGVRRLCWSSLVPWCCAAVVCLRDCVCAV